MHIDNRIKSTEVSGYNILQQKHVTQECSAVKKPCPFGCGNDFSAVDIQEHLNSCPMRTVSCKHCRQEVREKELQVYTHVHTYIDASTYTCADQSSITCSICLKKIKGSGLLCNMHLCNLTKIQCTQSIQSTTTCMVSVKYGCLSCGYIIKVHCFLNFQHG